VRRAAALYRGCIRTLPIENSSAIANGANLSCWLRQYRDIVIRLVGEFVREREKSVAGPDSILCAVDL
jgi:hypothetical protein